MSRSLDLSFHAWRGVGPDVEPDLFLFRWRMGFLTVSFCRVILLAAHRRLRERVAAAIALAERAEQP